MNTYRITLKIKLKKVEKSPPESPPETPPESPELPQSHRSLHSSHSPHPPTYSDIYHNHSSHYQYHNHKHYHDYAQEQHRSSADDFKEKKVAILGSGPGGLVSAKYALEHGLKPIIFEKKSGPGGLWSSNTAIWDGMHTNVSKYSVMFSDFPWPRDSSVIPSAADVYNYLLNYIRHFKLEKYFRLNSHVTSVRQLSNKKWEVNWLQNGEKRFTEVWI